MLWDIVKKGFPNANGRCFANSVIMLFRSMAPFSRFVRQRVSRNLPEFHKLVHNALSGNVVSNRELTQALDIWIDDVLEGIGDDAAQFMRQALNYLKEESEIPGFTSKIKISDLEFKTEYINPMASSTHCFTVNHNLSNKYFWSNKYWHYDRLWESLWGLSFWEAPPEIGKIFQKENLECIWLLPIYIWFWDIAHNSKKRQFRSCHCGVFWRKYAWPLFFTGYRPSVHAFWIGVENTLSEVRFTWKVIWDRSYCIYECVASPSKNGRHGAHVFK